MNLTDFRLPEPLETDGARPAYSGPTATARRCHPEFVAPGSSAGSPKTPPPELRHSCGPGTSCGGGGASWP
jgi:hypothetical protein